MDTTQTPPPTATPQYALTSTEEGNLKLAAQIASANLLIAQQTLGERIIDPTITTKGLLDIAEHSFKVSGMAKKQEAKEESGKFIFNIHFPGGADLKIEKVINGDSLDVDTPAVLLEAATTLAANVDPFPECPEF